MDATRREILINRVIGREEDADDWRELRELGGADAELWREIALGLEDDATLRGSARGALAAAAQVDLPDPLPPAQADESGPPRRLPELLGWLAAVVAVALWLFEVPVPGSVPGPREPQVAAGQDPVRGDGFEVVGELPRVLVSTSPTEDGDQFDAIYLRRILERKRVTEVFELRHDELGRTWADSVQPAAYVRPQSF